MYRVSFNDNNQSPTFIVGFFIALGCLLLLIASSVPHAMFLLFLTCLAFYFSWHQLIKSTPQQGVLFLLDNGDIELVVDMKSVHFQMLHVSFATDTAVFFYLKSQHKRWLIVYRRSVNAVDYARMRRHISVEY